MKRLATVIAVVVPALAGAEGLNVAPLVGLKAQFGGDSLATILYQDGSTQDLLAGQGIDFYVGAKAESYPFVAKGSLGFKYSSSMASNIDVAKTALPLQLTGRYMATPDIFVGAGLTMHLNPKLAIDEFVAEYDAAPGFHVEAGWRMVSVGWTHMTYTLGAIEFDASSVDINVEWVF